ncbi:ATP-binding cassette domain-containing protein [bacterium]|jgi:ABC-2 type transport system ATP-binding protein|nr:ATP-binding cassette domain-containing protein [bacterium]
MIDIQDLHKYYGKEQHALKGISLQFDKGLIGLLGPNGAGKTTLIRILAGILQASSGSVRILGQDMSTITGRQAVKAQLGYLPQHIGMYPKLSAHEFLRFIAGLKHLDAVDAEVDRVLEIVRLTDDQNRPVGTFSGGMKRRVGIAQALLGQPAFIIVDEPTTGLDPEERLRIRNTLAQIATECIVLLSTHIIEDVSQSCRTVAILNQGQILFYDEPRTLAQIATGKVGEIVLQDGTPPQNLKVVSSRQLAEGMAYRVLGEALPTNVQAVQPTLEDGYLWTMQHNTT